MKNIVVDLDGTLLRSDKTISPQSQKILEELNRSGKRIIIATARPPRGVYGWIPGPFASFELIFYNGALVHQNRKVIFETTIEEKVAVEIKRILESHSERIVFGFEQNDWLYSNGSFEHHWSRSLYTEVDLNSFAIQCPAKILVDLPDQAILEYLRNKLPHDCRLMVTDRNTLGQIMNRNVSKYAALLALLKDTDEIASQTFCFGNDANDMDIFEHCSNSVAMANSTEEILSKAKYLTKSNDEDGVAYFLKNYFAAELGRT